MRRYVVVINGQVRELPADWVLPWVHGVAEAHDGGKHLAVLDANAPEETNRMQALQIGDAQGWFSYKYILRD